MSFITGKSVVCQTVFGLYIKTIQHQLCLNSESLEKKIMKNVPLYIYVFTLYSSRQVLYIAFTECMTDYERSSISRRMYDYINSYAQQQQDKSRDGDDRI